MTRREVRELLEKSGVPDAGTDARLLLSHYGAVTQAYLLANPDYSLETEEFLTAVRRRAAREPLAYITGEAPFFSEEYTVSPDCLIPRFDTELLVEKAVELLPENAVFADLCTGSGCIAVSALRHRKDTRAAAYEISRGALAVAEKNAEKNGVAARLTLRQADLLSEPLPENAFDAILSNPPYIRTDVVPQLDPEVKNEPVLALDGGADGLTFYRRFLTAFRRALRPRGFFLFEIGYDQGDALAALAKEHGFHCTLYRDMGGNPRVVLLTPAPHEPIEAPDSRRGQ